METLYRLAVRLEFQAMGLNAGIMAAVSMFEKLKSKAAAAESAAAKMAQRLSAMNPSNANFSKAQGQMLALQSQATALAQKYESARKSMGLLAAGAVITGIGAIGANLFAGSIEQAASFEQALNNVNIATENTRGKIQQLQQLKNIAFTVSGKTQFSSLDIVNMAKLAASNGLNSVPILNKTLPLLAKGAEVAMVTRGVSYQESIPAFVQMAHLFNRYGTKATGGTKAFNQMIDLAARALPLSGGTPEQLTTMLSYLKPAMNSLGLNPKDSIGFVAAAMRMGLGHGRGGASLAAMMRGIGPQGGDLYSRLTHHNEALEAIQKAGKGHFFVNGKFQGMSNLMAIVSRAMLNTPNQQVRLAELQSVFGAAGSRVAASLSGPGALAQWANVQKMLGPKGIMPTGQMQSSIAGTTASQFRILKTNLQNIAILIGSQLLPAANSFLHLLTGLTAQVVKFAESHKDLVKFAAIFGAIATGIALIVGPVLMAVGAIGLLTIGFSGLTIAMGPITLVILGIAAAVAGITLLVMNWGKVTAFLKGVWNGFTQALRIAGDVITKALHNPIVQVIEKMSPLYWLIKAIILVFQALSPVIKAVADQIGNLLKQIKDVPGLVAQLTQLVPGVNLVTGAGNFAGMVGQNGNNILNWAGVGADNPDNPNFNKTQKKPVHSPLVHHTSTHNEHKTSNTTHNHAYTINVQAGKGDAKEIAGHVKKAVSELHEHQTKQARDHSVHHPKLIPNYGRRLL